MKKLIAMLVSLGALLALPALASAHTGTLKCDATGVVFSYRANFERTTTVTETVNGVLRTFVVSRWKAATDTWLGVTGTITAGATWRGGGIKTVTLTCPAPPTPPATPPNVPPAPPAPPASPPAVPAVPAVPAAPVAPAVTPPTTPPATHTSPAKCPKGTLDLGLHAGVKMCLRVVRVPAKKAPKGVKGVVSKGGKKTPKFHSGGVTG